MNIDQIAKRDNSFPSISDRVFLASKDLGFRSPLMNRVFNTKVLEGVFEGAPSRTLHSLFSAKSFSVQAFKVPPRLDSRSYGVHTIFSRNEIDLFQVLNDRDYDKFRIEFRLCGELKTLFKLNEFQSKWNDDKTAPLYRFSESHPWVPHSQKLEQWPDVLTDAFRDNFVRVMRQRCFGDV